MTTSPPTAETPSKEHEDPALSSASLCIQFHLLGGTFGPVFTHQAFPGEWIRGYHPPLKRLMALNSEAQAQQDDDDSTKPTLLHSSHVHHETASKELSIDVKLSPSCQACKVDICTEQKRLPRRQSQRASKRRRVAVTPPSEAEKTDSADEDEDKDEDEAVKEESADENEDYDGEGEEDEDEEVSVSEPEYNEEDDDEEEKDDDSEFEVDGNVSEVEEEDDNEGATRKSRLPTKDILDLMKKGLPNVTDKKVDGSYGKKPLGVELKEYSVKGKDFVLCLATGTEAAKYHKDVQRLALWFIETADDVDVASKEGGFWRVLYLYRKHKRCQYSLAGYTTLFHFHAPFKKPKPGYVVRVCQALILPTYQRAGHGKQMLTCVMDIAHGQYAKSLSNSAIEKDGDERDDEIVEINVEWPAPAFILLRNRTDYDCFVRSIKTKEPWFQVDNSDGVSKEDFFVALPESDTVKAAAKAKIIPRQIQIVEELFKLQKLHDHLESSGKERKQELEKRYRLMVKKRLNKENREHLSGFRTKAEKQAFLEEEFGKCLESYQTTLCLPKVGASSD